MARATGPARRWRGTATRAAARRRGGGRRARGAPRASCGAEPARTTAAPGQAEATERPWGRGRSSLLRIPGVDRRLEVLPDLDRHVRAPSSLVCPPSMNTSSWSARASEMSIVGSDSWAIAWTWAGPFHADGCQKSRGSTSYCLLRGQGEHLPLLVHLAGVDAVLLGEVVVLDRPLLGLLVLRECRVELGVAVATVLGWGRTGWRAAEPLDELAGRRPLLVLVVQVRHGDAVAGGRVLDELRSDRRPGQLLGVRLDEGMGGDRLIEERLRGDLVEAVVEDRQVGRGAQGQCWPYRIISW